MELVWNWWGVLGAIGLVVAGFLSVVVFLAAPDRPVNRRLALVLLVEGITVTVCAAGLDIFVASAPDYYAMQAIHAMTVLAIPWLYLLFLGAALDTPLVAPLKHRAALPVIVGIILALQALRFFYREQFVAGLVTPWYAPWALVEGPWFHLATQFWAVVSIYGLVAGFDAYRRGRTEIARKRSRAYMMAFGLRDIYWIVLLLVVMPYMKPYESVFWGIFFTQGMSLGHLLFVALVGYGILKTQMFDIDLRIKWSLRQSTVAASFVGVFFVVSEGAQSILSSRLGPILGLAGAGLLVFALAPVQRFADRVSNAAMPNVRESPEYVAYRKTQVYRAAVEGALTDGGMSAKERTILDRLRAELGLANDVALEVEKDVQRVLAPAAA